MGVLPKIFTAGDRQSQHWEPGAYASILYATSASGNVSTSNVVILGYSEGGEPNKLHNFASFAEARNVLREGALLNALFNAFEPGPGFTPQKIGAWRVNPGTRATKRLTKADAGLAEVRTLTITNGCTTSGNLTLTLNSGTPVVIAVLDTDTTPTAVATKIRLGSFTGWTTGGTGAVVTFTATSVGVRSGTYTFSPASTGVTAPDGFVQTAIGRASGNVDIIKLTAWDWGAHGNKVKVQIGAGTTGKKISTGFQSEPDYIKDNIFQESFEVQYIGMETACTITINSSGITTVTTAHTDELNMPFTTYTTINDVVSYIDNHTNYTCIVKTTDGTQLSSQLDAVTDVDIKADAVVLYSNLQAVIDEYARANWIGESLYTDNVLGRVMPDNTSTWEYFTGGTAGDYTTSEYTDSLSLLEEEDVQLVGSTSESEFVHALIKTHCETMCSLTKKKERQFVLGGASGETVDEFITRCKVLNSAAGALVYPEFQWYNITKTATVWWSPAYYAAKLLGMLSTLSLPETPTNKDLHIFDFVRINSVDRERCIQNGGTVGKVGDDGRYITVRMLNTYQGSNILINEFSAQREVLYATRYLRTQIHTNFTGKPASPGRKVEMESSIRGILDGYVTLGIFANWSNLVVQVQGDTVTIEYDADVVLPLNFTFITAHFSTFTTI